jgi:hypothetical protein
MSPLIRLIFVSIFAVWTTLGLAEDRVPSPITQNEKLELEIYRSASSAAYQEHLANYYRQQTQLGDLIVRVFNWQLLAANVVLALVVFLATSGIALSVYQLWVSGRLAQLAQRQRRSKAGEDHPGNVGLDQHSSLEVSSDKLRLQTSLVGLLVLIVSGAFLLLFVREVYRINVVDMDARRTWQKSEMNGTLMRSSQPEPR